ncbi:MAG: hypothetical protein CMC08_06690 [Flavobacteriaceae bacterium]|nr:hypothetical protein [Flavobacteriaceae bacterium]
MVPVTATQVTAFTYSNASSFLSQLSNFRSDTAPTTIPTLFETVSEIGEISLPAGTAIALKSIDPQLTADALASSLTQMGTFREVTLYSFAAPDFFHDYLKPLINFKQASVAFQLDSFFIVAENETVAQEIISCATSGTCLSQAPFFSETSAQLSTASSLLRLSLQGSVAESVSRQMESLFGMPSLTESLPNYPLTAHQFTYDRNFAHVTFLCQESRATGPALTGGISESFTLQLENGVLMPPQFFSNHRTGGHDIVVQDMANKLYLLSSEGKTLWKKQLDNPVLGGIEEVDLLRNGNKQFAFATKNKVYVLDRTGASVGSFPLQFKDAITQPLSVFDYDNNRKYRFVVTQGDNVLMYGPDGKMIRGFSFKKAKSEIVLPPQHIRMGNKDYIAIAEKNGSLNLLHRTGRIRVPLASKFQFSEIPIAEEGNAFVVITADNNKVSITQEGKTSSQALNVSGNYWFTTLGRTKATLDDNLLRINGNLAELPFGVYTPPKIVQIGKQQLITLTETQENKVYVFTTEATLLPGFPVYGTSIAALRQGSSGERAQLVVAGPNKEIILYSWSF